MKSITQLLGVVTVASMLAIAFGAQAEGHHHHHHEAPVVALSAALDLERRDVGTVAFVSVDHSAYVKEVIFSSPDGDWVPANEIEPGLWVSEPFVDDNDSCFEATADIYFAHQKSEKRSCIESITVRHVDGELLTASGDQVGHPNTLFTASSGATAEFHTSCSHCIREGEVDASGQFEIVGIVDDGLLELKCSGGSANGGKAAKDARHQIEKLLKKSTVHLSLTAAVCDAHLQCDSPTPDGEPQPTDGAGPVPDSIGFGGN